MKTMTNTEREQFFNEIIEGIDKEIEICVRKIEFTPMLVRCNCIVATEDAEYQVGVDENSHATILIGNHTNPVWMTEKAAKDLLYEQNFKASNGNGPLSFKIWDWKSFFRRRLKNLHSSRETIIQALEMALATD